MILEVHRTASAHAPPTEDRNLGAGELGLLLYLLSLPEGSGISARLLGLRFRCSHGRIRQFCRKLKMHGYLRHEMRSRPPRMIVSAAPIQTKR